MELVFPDAIVPVKGGIERTTLSDAGDVMTMEIDPEYRDRQRNGQGEQPGNANEAPRPFDVSELGKIPVATDHDPPYRDWWAVKDQPGDGEPSPS